MLEYVGMGPTSPEAWMAIVATQQHQKGKEWQQVLHPLAKQQQLILDQLVVAQAQTSQQHWDWVTQDMLQRNSNTPGGELGGGPDICTPTPIMTVNDNPRSIPGCV